MNIQISKEAEHHIEKNGKNAYVMIANISGCCSRSEMIPEVFMGLPKDTTLYIENKIRSISIFVDKNIEPEEKIRISLDKLMWLKRLTLQ